jgi:hypothetical protein
MEKKYETEKDQEYDTERYRRDLISELANHESYSEKSQVLRNEIIAITRHITDGVRDLIKQDSRIRDLVLNQGAIPLATWTESLDTMATYSMERIRSKILEMKQELEYGKVQGFPATMYMAKKASFTTLEGFYETIFNLADDISTQ